MQNPTILGLLAAAYGAGHAWASAQPTAAVDTTTSAPLFTSSIDTAWPIPLPTATDDYTSIPTTAAALSNHELKRRQSAPPARPTPTPITLILTGGTAPPAPTTKGAPPPPPPPRLTLTPAGSVYHLNPGAGTIGSAATTFTLAGGTVVRVSKADSSSPSSPDSDSSSAPDDPDPAAELTILAQAPGGAQALATIPPPPIATPSPPSPSPSPSPSPPPDGHGNDDDDPPPPPSAQSAAAAQQSSLVSAASAAVVHVGALELSPAGLGSGAYNVLKSVGAGVGVAATLVPGGSVTVDGVVVGLETDRAVSGGGGTGRGTVVVTGDAGGGDLVPAATVTAAVVATPGGGGGVDDPVEVGNLTFLPAGSAYWVAEGSRTWTVMTGAPGVTVGGGEGVERTVVGLATDAGGRTVVVESGVGVAGNRTAVASTVATLGVGGSASGGPGGMGPGGGGGQGGGGPLMTSNRMGGAPLPTDGSTSAGASYRVGNAWPMGFVVMGFVVGVCLL